MNVGRGLVYLFILVTGLALAGAAWLGLTFSPVEAICLALVGGCVVVLLLERRARLRAEARLEKAMEDLSRLVSTDAETEQLLGLHVAAMAEVPRRLDAVEADMAVMGSAVGQLVDSVAALERGRRRRMPAPQPPPAPERRAGPVISRVMLDEALADPGRWLCRLDPILSLPSRRLAAHDLAPALKLEDGEIAELRDFLPTGGGADGALRRIERYALDEAIGMGRSARTRGRGVLIHVPLSAASLGEPGSLKGMLATLDANGALAEALCFRMADAEWQRLGPEAREAAASVARLGFGLSLSHCGTLRRDFADLAAAGIRSLRVDADRLFGRSGEISDLPVADLPAYLRRFRIELVVTGITGEQQALQAVEEGIGLAQGPYLRLPDPSRPELVPQPATGEPSRPIVT